LAVKYDGRLNLESSRIHTVSADATPRYHRVLERHLGAGATGATTLSVAERERRQVLWWYVLVAAVLLLAAESLLSNRLSRSARPDVALAEGRMDHA